MKINTVTSGVVVPSSFWVSIRDHAEEQGASLVTACSLGEDDSGGSASHLLTGSCLVECSCLLDLNNWRAVRMNRNAATN